MRSLLVIIVLAMPATVRALYMDSITAKLTVTQPSKLFKK